MRIFSSQEEMQKAFKAGELNRDVIVVVRFQGPRANGMPELHKLLPPLQAVQSAGYKVALVTDGRLSGASGEVLSAIHLTPEAAEGGPIAKLRDGDRVRIDSNTGELTAMVDRSRVGGARGGAGGFVGDAVWGGERVVQYVSADGESGGSGWDGVCGVVVLRGRRGFGSGWGGKVVQGLKPGVLAGRDVRAEARTYPGASAKARARARARARANTGVSPLLRLRRRSR